jgi:hypothetical protein
MNCLRLYCYMISFSRDGVIVVRDIHSIYGEGKQIPIFSFFFFGSFLKIDTPAAPAQYYTHKTTTTKNNNTKIWGDDLKDKRLEDRQQWCSEQ